MLHGRMLSDVFVIIIGCYKWIGSWGWTPSGVPKERVTLWSGVSGAESQPTGFSGQRPEWDGAKPSPSGEPTTTEAQPVVIVGYNKASLVACAAIPFVCQLAPSGYCSLIS